MDSFANKHFEPYLLDKELHYNVLKENPVTDNADQVKKLDDFAMSILEDSVGLPKINWLIRTRTLRRSY